MLNGFLILILAHLLTDFVFQTDNLIKRKQELRINAYGIHVFLFFLLGLFLYGIIMGLTGKIVLGLAALSVFHGFLDFLKQVSGKFLKIRISEIILLIIDQTAHILSISIFIVLLFRNDFNDVLANLNSTIIADCIRWPQKLIIVVCLLIVVTSVSNTIIRLFLKPLKAETTEKQSESNEEKELKVGRYIGSAERILTVFAVLASSYEVLIALYASKTAIRYPKVKNEESFAEYYFLGTSVSAIIGIIIGLILRTILSINNS